jgi:predicted dehydrogenase
MDIDPSGRPVAGELLAVGAVGCGSHAYRNVFPALTFLPARLVACCDLDLGKAESVAGRYGAHPYDSLDRMLEAEKLDAVLIVVGYDEHGRPLYPEIAAACVARGVHAWIEKPPAASCGEIEAMHEASTRADRTIAVGFKKQYAPANRKAGELRHEIGETRLVLARYPLALPSTESVRVWRNGERDRTVVSYLDHLCHPASLLVSWLGMPRDVTVRRGGDGAAVLLIGFRGEVLANLSLTTGASSDGGLESSTIVGSAGHVNVVDNLRVEWRRYVGLEYGRSLDYYRAAPGETTAVWEPEHSLGQLYNKGIVQLGYVDEIGDFLNHIRNGGPLRFGTLADAWAVTSLFETTVDAEDSAAVPIPNPPDWVVSTLAGRETR